MSDGESSCQTELKHVVFGTADFDLYRVNNILESECLDVRQI